MDSHFVLFNNSNVLDVVNRHVAEGVFTAAEEMASPYMIEVRNILEDDPFCAGIIGMFWSEDSLGYLQKSGLPAVNLANTRGPVPHLGNVLSDDREVGRMAARHLLSRGYQHFLGLGTHGITYSVERLSGFREILAEKGFACPTVDLDSKLPKVAWNPHSYQQHIWQQVREAILDSPMDTGVFVVSDWLAWPVLRSVEEHEKQRLPTMGILGVDNLHGGRFDPRKAMRLSSIQPGFRQAGKVALKVLLDHVIHGNKLEVIHRIPPDTLIERASTAGPACADPLIARIIREIWHRIRSQTTFTLGQLARDHGMSSSSFEKKFRAILGKSAREMVTEMRIDYAKQLLASKAHQIGEICYLCGYANPSSFSNAFKEATGLSPRDWQKQ